MKLRDAEAELKTLKLPDWVRDVSVEEDFDQDGETYMRVWLRVADDFEYNYGDYDKVATVEEQIRQHLWDAGVTEWVQVSMGSGEEE